MSACHSQLCSRSLGNGPRKGFVGQGELPTMRYGELGHTGMRQGMAGEEQRQKAAPAEVVPCASLARLLGMAGSCE